MKAALAQLPAIIALSAAFGPVVVFLWSRA